MKFGENITRQFRLGLEDQYIFDTIFRETAKALFSPNVIELFSTSRICKSPSMLLQNITIFSDFVK